MWRHRLFETTVLHGAEELLHSPHVVAVLALPSAVRGKQQFAAEESKHNLLHHSVNISYIPDVWLHVTKYVVSPAEGLKPLVLFSKLLFTWTLQQTPHHPGVWLMVKQRLKGLGRKSETSLNTTARVFTWSTLQPSQLPAELLWICFDIFTVDEF